MFVGTFRMALQYLWNRLVPCCSLGPCYIFIPFILFLYNNYLHEYIDPIVGPVVKPVWALVDPYIGWILRNEKSPNQVNVKQTLSYSLLLIQDMRHNRKMLWEWERKWRGRTATCENHQAKSQKSGLIYLLEINVAGALISVCQWPPFVQ